LSERTFEQFFPNFELVAKNRFSSWCLLAKEAITYPMRLLASYRPGRILLMISTLAGFAMVGHSLLVGPLPLTITLSYLLGYIGLVLLGVFVPWLGMWAEIILYIPESSGVALTFDDGPHPTYTKEVLDTLDTYQIKATFFLIGEKVKKYPDIAKEIVRRGHDVGSHGYKVDRWLTLRGQKAVDQDLAQSVAIIEEITGIRPVFFRPPYGFTNPRLARAAEQLDLLMVGWNVRGLDGVAWTTEQRLLTRVVPQLKPGSIVCLHDAAELEDRVPVVPKALPALCQAVFDKQLTAQRISDMLGEQLSLPPTTNA
jgi:peptidoglycan-N-acetylglucosamine deacetylase